MTTTSAPRCIGASTIFGIVLALTTWMGTIGCAGPGGSDVGVTVEWTVHPDPARIGSAQVAVAIEDPSGQPIEGADVVLEGTMTHPGMPPVLAAARESSPGRYEAVLELTMAGDWILLLEATLADGTTIRRRHELPGVRAQ